jgi:hypothetical protein
MTFRIRTLAVCLLGALVVSGSAQAQFLLNPGGKNGGEAQIGTGLPLPIGTMGIFFGGMTPATAGTMFWPPLLVGRAPTTMGTIMQALNTPQGGALTVPAGILTDMIGGVPRGQIGVFPTNPAVFAVRTTINYSWPNVAANFAPGGGPGLPGTPVVFAGPGGGSIAYNAGTKSFGGSGQFAIATGPFSGTLAVPPGGTMASKLPVASVWINGFKQLPATANKAILVGASNYNGVGAVGQSVMGLTQTTMYGQIPLAVRLFTAMLGPNGTIPLANSMGVAAAALTNMVAGTKGFPWTTGLITVTAPGAAPAEVFFLSGTDMRVAGIGNVSMVSGALGLRKLSLANANRGWVSLTIPEPTAALGAAAALSMLGLCHMVVRRRSN